ncbi:MAG: sigma-70 family RNA polymerase sigma factor [Calditrichaeota bacterium]|nr:MAG: sigma-70 family RNA polymerase sigma factor [Calditrichota bacterium]
MSEAKQNLFLKDQDECLLVERCKRELPYHTEAFEILVRRYEKRVFQKALSMLKNRQDAEDAAQEVFVKIFKALPKFEGKSSFSTWVYAITVNTCLHQIEKRERRPWWWLTADLDELNEAQQADEQLFLLVSGGLEREDLRRQIDETLAKLEPLEREILIERFWEEKTLQEIARNKGLKLSAVKMRVKRAREKFIQQIMRTQREERI